MVKVHEDSGILNLTYLNEITGGDAELRDELISLFESDLGSAIRTDLKG